MSTTTNRSFKFDFVVGENKYHVTVDGPTPASPIRHVRVGDTASRDVFRSLRKQLTVQHIATQPNPTATLVQEIPKTRAGRRIDTQPATAVWRNIHYQEGHLSFAAVTVDYGAEFCYAVGLDRKLLKYVRRGLDLSFESRNSEGQRLVHHIRVKIERRSKKSNVSQEIKLDANGLDKLHTAFVMEMNTRKKQKEGNIIWPRNYKVMAMAMGLSDELEELLAQIMSEFTPAEKMLLASADDSEDDSDDEFPEDFAAAAVTGGSKPVVVM